MITIYKLIYIALSEMSLSQHGCDWLQFNLAIRHSIDAELVGRKTKSTKTYIL